MALFLDRSPARLLGWSARGWPLDGLSEGGPRVIDGLSEGGPRVIDGLSEGGPRDLGQGGSAQLQESWAERPRPSGLFETFVKIKLRSSRNLAWSVLAPVLEFDECFANFGILVLTLETFVKILVGRPLPWGLFETFVKTRPPDRLHGAIGGRFWRMFANFVYHPKHSPKSGHGDPNLHWYLAKSGGSWSRGQIWPDTNADLDLQGLILTSVSQNIANLVYDSKQ